MPGNVLPLKLQCIGQRLLVCSHEKGQLLENKSARLYGTERQWSYLDKQRPVSRIHFCASLRIHGEQLQETLAVRVGREISKSGFDPIDAVSVRMAGPCTPIRVVKNSAGR